MVSCVRLGENCYSHITNEETETEKDNDPEGREEVHPRSKARMRLNQDLDLHLLAPDPDLFPLYEVEVFPLNVQVIGAMNCQKACI